MDNLVYVVKSMDRLERFYQKTYANIILKYKFSLTQVFVFVSTKKDLKEYKARYPEINIVLGPRGVAGIDNFITNYFDAGQKMIYMNDDVSSIEIVNRETKKFTPLTKRQLEKRIKKMFACMDHNDITYGGFYPVMNHFFMKKGGYDYGLRLIMDPFSLVRNNKNIKVTVGDKSDFEKSIQHFMDKGLLLRCNDIALKVEYYGTKGGFQGRDAETEMNSAQEMKKKYPYAVSKINVKKHGRTSLRLIKIPAMRNYKPCI